MSWRHLLNYWQNKCIGDGIPLRAEIDPVIDIPQLVPSLFMIDVLPDGFRVRLQGSAIVEHLGADNTGKPVDVVHPERRPKVEAWTVLLRKAAAERRPVLYVSAPSVSAARSAYGLLLPLGDSTGAVSLVLGGLFSDARLDPETYDVRPPANIAEVAITPHGAERLSVREPAEAG